MAEYRWDRRTDAIPPLHPITKSEAAEKSDLRRESTYERAREAIADDIRKQNDKGRKRQFAELVKKKKK